MATAQHGFVTYAQLRAVGIGPNAIAHRVERGRLHRWHTGVYLVGHEAVPPLGHEMAAVLACGEGALISHRTAASLWSLPAPTGDAVDVTVVGRDPGRRRGVRVHRVRFLHPTDLRRHQGIPLTSPARTLIDLAEVVSRRDLERAYDEARFRELVTREELFDLLARSPGRRGQAPLRSLLDLDAVTRSAAERSSFA